MSIITTIFSLILTAAVSYLLGSLNSAIITVRVLKHEDIREKGSGSAGLTNTYRCYGALPAALTLIGDLAKGVIAVLISIYVIGAIVPVSPFLFDSLSVGYLSGIFAIIGHIFPVYYHFKGGRGVLVAASILLVIDPLTFAIIIPFFILMIAVTRYVSVASITSAVVYPILTFCLHYFVEFYSLEQCIAHFVLTTMTSALLIYMHKDNIKRLLSHTENKFTIHRKNK
ncbi:MAG: glycerol-3-phosphate 1-O-acyltransferase PlsY [Ruminococcus sp.]|jgi:glycerol-3-phosphate acyltransferase PlsY|nr:glycerol-3-phosphate 1-O-acyltransferase PlsY [Ruminococcus sp.]